MFESTCWEGHSSIVHRLAHCTMSQMYSQMSQIGDELDGDAAFGEFAAAWDSHTPAVPAAAASSSAPQEASEVTHAGGGQFGPAKQAQILKSTLYSDFYMVYVINMYVLGH